MKWVSLSQTQGWSHHDPRPERSIKQQRFAGGGVWEALHERVVFSISNPGQMGDSRLFAHGRRRGHPWPSRGRRTVQNNFSFVADRGQDDGPRVPLHWLRSPGSPDKFDKRCDGGPQPAARNRSPMEMRLPPCKAGDRKHFSASGSLG